MSSRRPIQPRRLLNNNEEQFKKIFGRFMFNIEQIERKYCNTNSGLVYDTRTDKITFEQGAVEGLADDKETRAEFRKIQNRLFCETFGSALLSTPVQDPDEKNQTNVTRWKKMNKLFDQFATDKLKLNLKDDDPNNENPETMHPSEKRRKTIDTLSIAPIHGSQQPTSSATGMNSNAVALRENPGYLTRQNVNKFGNVPKFISFYDHSEMGSVIQGSHEAPRVANPNFTIHKMFQNSQTEFSQKFSTQQKYTLNVGDTEFEFLKRRTITKTFDRPESKEVKEIFSSPDVVSAWVNHARRRTSTGNVDTRDLVRENEEYESRLDQSLTYGENHARSLKRKQPLALMYDADENGETPKRAPPKKRSRQTI